MRSIQLACPKTERCLANEAQSKNNFELCLAKAFAAKNLYASIDDLYGLTNSNRVIDECVNITEVFEQNLIRQADELSKDADEYRLHGECVLALLNFM